MHLSVAKTLSLEHKKTPESYSNMAQISGVWTVVRGRCYPWTVAPQQCRRPFPPIIFRGVSPSNIA